jgi:phospholipid transport system transporter-binding protein
MAMLTLTLSPKIKLANAQAELLKLRAGLAQAGKGQAVELDAAALELFDSSALAVLLDAQRTALAHDQKLSIKNLRPGLQSLVRVYGLSELLPA